MTDVHVTGGPWRACIGLLTIIASLWVIPTQVAAQVSPLSAPSLPATIALFPLPNIAVLPYQEIPLRIFEPRYQAMLRDVMAGDRVVGIIQIQPGFEAEYLGRPPLFSFGTAVMVVRADTQPNGESEIVVRAFTKFHVTTEVESAPYRRAQVEAVPEILDDTSRAVLKTERPALEAAFAAALGVDPSTLRMPTMSDEDFVSTLVMALDFDTIDRQLLIEQSGVLARARKLIELLTVSSSPAKVP